MSIQDRIALFGGGSSQVSEKQSVKTKPSQEDVKTTKVAQGCFSPPPTPVSSVKEAPETQVNGPHKDSNHEKRAGLEQKGYTRKAISAVLRGLGVLHEVRYGLVSIDPYIKDIKAAGSQENLAYLDNLGKSYESSIIDAALEDLGLDKESLETGESVLSETDLQQLETMCQAKSDKLVRRLDSLITSFDEAYAKNDSSALIALRGKFSKLLSGGLSIPQRYEEAFSARQKFVTGLSRIQNTVNSHYEATSLEIQREHETEDKSFGAADFFNYYSISSFLQGSEEDRKGDLDAAMPHLTSFFDSGDFGIFDAKAAELTSKIDERKGALAPYFSWVAENKEYCVKQYDQTLDPRNKVNGSQKHFVCQSSSLHHVSRLVREPTLPFSQLDLNSTDEIIETTVALHSANNRYHPPLYTNLGLKAPDAKKDVTSLKGEHKDIDSIQKQLKKLEKSIKRPGLALINLDPPAGSNAMPHAILVQMDRENGSYRFIDAASGAYEYGDNREAFYKGVTSFMATTYHHLPQVSVQTLHAQS